MGDMEEWRKAIDTALKTYKRDLDALREYDLNPDKTRPHHSGA